MDKKNENRIEGIVLAAGYSKRAGDFKPLMEIKGKTVLERCMDGMADVCDRIIVVGGYGIEKLAAVVCKYPNAELIENPEYPKGMFTSVKAGARLAAGGRIFIVPGDHPVIMKSTYETLLNTWGDIILPVYEGTVGHPVLLSKRMIKALLSEPDTSCLRDFIAGHEALCVDVDDEGILADLDTPEDHERILKTLNGKERGKT